MFIKKIVISIFIIILVFVIRSKFFLIPLDIDQSVYAYIGYNWFHSGLVPYEDVFDHKPPLVYFLYGIVTYFSPSLFVIRFASTIYFLITLLAIYKATKLFFNTKAGFIALFISTIYLNSPSVYGFEFNSEHIMIFPLTLSLCYFWLGFQHNNLRRFFVSGFFLGLAILSKQVAIVNLPVLIVFLLLHRFKKGEIASIGVIRKILTTILGVLLPVSLVLFYFFKFHALNSFIMDVVIYNIFYIKRAILPISMSFIDQSMTFFYVPQVLSVLLIVSGISAIYLLRRHEAKGELLTMWLVASFIQVKIGGIRNFPHYFITLIPIMSIILSYFFQQAFLHSHAIKNRISKFIFLSTIVTICIILLIKPLSELFWSCIQNEKQISLEIYGEYDRGRFFDAQLVADYFINQVGRNSSGKRAKFDFNNKVFVFSDDPSILFYLGLKSPSSAIYYYNDPLPINNWMPSGLPFLYDIVYDWKMAIMKNKQKFVITRWQAEPFFSAFKEINFDSRYRVEKIIGQFVIYSLRDENDNN